MWGRSGGRWERECGSRWERECGSRETSLDALAPVQVRYKGSLDKGE